MSLFGFLKGEFVEIIEWQQRNEDDTLCWKFPHHDNAIKNGARLVVREGQRALFLHMGALPPDGAPAQVVSVETPHGSSQIFVGDTFGPGTYNLETRTLPILGRLQGWKHGFQSPFKADIFFTSTRRFTGLKWGTTNPIMLRDPEFGPVRIRAFGTFAIQVSDPVLLLRELVSTDPSFQTYEIATQLRSVVVSKFTTAIAEAKIPVLDMAASVETVGNLLRDRLTKEFAGMGLSVPIFQVENISLPPELEQVLDKRASMGILGNLDQYTKLQAANSLEIAAANPGGGAGAGMGLGAGIVMGQQLAAGLQPAAPAAAAPAPPPLPAAVAWFAGINGQQQGPLDITRFRELVRAGQITRDTLVWKAEMANWTPAGKVPELASEFAAVPPPFPPAT